MGKTVIVDYGSGNVFSVATALSKVNTDVVLSADPEDIAKADRLVLPGVGAFSAVWNLLAAENLIEPIHAFIAKDRPFLGICVGMQMMMQRSEEFGLHQGFGIIEGVVSKIAETGSDGTPHPVPRIGWYPLIENTQPWQGTLFDGISEDDAVYFVHSFAARPDDTRHILADSDYNGHSVTAAIIKDNAFGVQFHPEKSGAIGLHILQNFVTL